MTPGSWEELVARRSSEVRRGQETSARLLDEFAWRLRGGAAGSKLQSAAQYLREHPLRDWADGARRLVRRYPAPALLVAVAAGLLVVRAWRSR